jgi:hypothetical protein
MKALVRQRKPAQPTRSRQVTARKTVDAQFLALLRRKCMRAGSIGAFTAAGESIPGLGRVLGLVFGELLDAKLLATVQRELIEETFALYSLDVPTALHNTLVSKVQFVGTSASVAGDAFLRGVLRRALGRVGGLIARRVLPIAAIISSAFANATVTYAVGKRAQAVARLREAPISGMPDALRAFSGVDERRVFAWSLAAVKSSLGLVGKAFRTMTTSRLRARKPRPRRRK